FRAPVVLCYLEGLTHEQAAARLGWPLGSVRSRLARARDLLRGRLARLGLSPTIALLGVAPSPESSSAAVPSSLVDSTARLAMRFAVSRTAPAAGALSASADALAEGVLRQMFLTKLKIGGALLGFIVVGTGLVAHQTLARAGAKEDPPSAKAQEPPATDDA